MKRLLNRGLLGVRHVDNLGRQQTQHSGEPSTLETEGREGGKPVPGAQGAGAVEEVWPEL